MNKTNVVYSDYVDEPNFIPATVHWTEGSRTPVLLNRFVSGLNWSMFGLFSLVLPISNNVLRQIDHFAR